MVEVVGVRFKGAGKIYYFDPVDIDMKLSDSVLVETARGIEYGSVVLGPRRMEERDIVAPLKPVIRIATEKDIDQHYENLQKAKEAKRVCTEKILEHKLEMKIIDVEYTFDNNKLIFYFTADGRIDFRELVKDLASIFRTRIELRQIGVRDEAKILGGVGPCGRVTCCKQFLGEFEPVSIKMAKEQDLSLNPCKISGICGRLMCCLKYEQDAYEEILKRLPRYGDRVKTPLGPGTITSIYTLTETAQVRVRLKDGTDDMMVFDVAELEPIKAKKHPKKKKTQEKQSIK